jgi:hypothetical protein
MLQVSVTVGPLLTAVYEVQGDLRRSRMKMLDLHSTEAAAGVQTVQGALATRRLPVGRGGVCNSSPTWSV